MLEAFSRLLPPLNRFLDQIWPSVVATLIAAGLISGYNHAFSGHMQQPRMAALHEAAGLAAPTPATAAAKVKPAPETAADAVTIRERTDEPARVLEKEASGELGKDQTAIKVAAPAPQPAPRPTNVANPVPRSEPRVIERRAEPRVTSVEPRVSSVPYVVPPAAQPVTVAPTAPPLAAAPAALPPPVIMAPPPVASAQSMQQPMQQPMVMVPDRPTQRPPYEAQVEDVPPPPRGPIGAIVDTLKPSSLFARAREFGQRIEDAGNDILPNIRQ
ncbi:MAG: hypothetical protein QOG38_2974 [Hyphomicrobiales bacterium]|jgi:hypothetical protein|nr:hypothetical protein [Hyphomicrobiales bacterium]